MLGNQFLKKARYFSWFKFDVRFWKIIKLHINIDHLVQKIDIMIKNNMNGLKCSKKVLVLLMSNSKLILKKFKMYIMLICHYISI